MPPKPSTQQATPRGLRRLAAPVTFGVLHLAPVVSEYMQCYPEVTCDVAISDRFVNLIEEGFDLAIRIGELEDSNLIARQLASARLVPCAAPNYLDRAGRPQTPADLSRHACLIYGETGSPATWHFEAPDGGVETVRVSGPLTATNPAFVHRKAVAGHGVVLGPSFSFAKDKRCRIREVCRAVRSTQGQGKSSEPPPAFPSTAQ